MIRDWYSPLAARAFWWGFGPWMRRHIHGVHTAGVPAHVAHDRPLVLVANHVSWWDGFFLMHLQREMWPESSFHAVMLESELRQHGFLRFLGALGITPGSPGTTRNLLRFFEQKRSQTTRFTVAYFPQGIIRPAWAYPLHFRRGASAVVRALAPATVLPVGLHIEPMTAVAPSAFVSCGVPLTCEGAIDESQLELLVGRELHRIRAFVEEYAEDTVRHWPERHMTLPDPSDTREQVVLVDENDRETGRGLKYDVHRSGVLHRAFSVFVFDRSGRLLLQQRAPAKYHSPGVWSNTCCGHPRPGEPAGRAAQRRLAEEMGFVCELREMGAFRYRAPLAGGMIEHEYDHVYVGHYDGEPIPASGEVSAYRWVELSELWADLARRPEVYSVWLPEALRVVSARKK